ncbi:MAG TPA: hypothetical protein H9871_11125, partial [Candidatus Nesterenkonia stercoripullorum]|nr:hypothetical protein [Candidatus Nesterenkonia stercoripullorum]
RALTNLTGNGIGSLVVARWTKAQDRERLKEVLNNPRSVDVDELMRLDNEGTEPENPYDDANLIRSSSAMDRKTSVALGPDRSDT